MIKFADYTTTALQALQAGSRKQFAQLMEANYQLRFQLYGAAMNAPSVHMHDIARKHGFSSTLTGSGGAICGLWRDGIGEELKLKECKWELEAKGYVFCMVKVME